ncbi:hypothetical protein CHISP_2780 [Chitinispirillum alkaliphilum]|nr:hypothetical protein CHISP_2780 [Chitinispirillum alkaliphilum]
MKILFNPRKCCYLLLALSLLTGKNVFAVGQSAVITLTFPTGGRPTALGEAFTALADDANATFYNPAGLGLSPLASTWKTFLPDEPFTSVASMSRTEFGFRDRVWAGSPNGIIRFNGRVWVDYETHLLDQESDLLAVARQFVNTNQDDIVLNAAWEIMKKNNLGMNRHPRIFQLLSDHLDQEKLSKEHKSVEMIARRISLLPANRRTYSNVHGVIHPYIESSKEKILTDSITALLSATDREMDDLLELKIPFSVAVTDSVTSLAIDNSENLWVATPSGLWRRDERNWRLYNTENGLPSNNITTVVTGPNGQIAVGTDRGAAILRAGEWKVINSENGLPHSLVNAIAFDFSNSIFVGTPNGLLQKTDDEITILDTSSGILSNNITALLYDSQERLWIGGEDGVTMKYGNRWRRFRFPESIVHCFAEHNNQTIWIGTNKGAVTYREGRAGTGREAQPEWNTYHSRNALRGDDVRSITVLGNDVWLATDKAIHQYDYSERQFLFFYEQLLPVFRLPDLFHLYSALVIPTEEWGTFGFHVNYINMGSNEFTDEMERYLGQIRSWEGVFGLSYGFALQEDLALGLNIKYVHSALAPGIGADDEGIGRTFAIDASVLKRNFLIDNFDVGFMFQNMGPKIFYIDEDQADPIPFTLRLGTAYRAVQTPVHDLTLVFDAYREVVKTYPDKDPDPFWKALWTGLIADEDETWIEELQHLIFGIGAEYWYSDFLALRTGFLSDYVGERFELTFGLGIKYGNLNFDWSYIHSPEGFMGGLMKRINSEKRGAHGPRDGQWRASFLFSF